jgi:TonB family protein
VSIILGIIFALRYIPNKGNGSVPTPSPQFTPYESNSVPTVSGSPQRAASKNAVVTAPAAGTPPIGEKKEAGNLEADPALFPRETKQQPSPGTPMAAPDYNGTFSPKEVDVKAKILSKPQPAYTEAARKNQVSGTVTIRAVFSSTGQVTNVRAVNSLPDGLTERAIEAARNIRFVPATKDGHPVSMYVTLEYNFNLY